MTAGGSISRVAELRPQLVPALQWKTRQLRRRRSGPPPKGIAANQGDVWRPTESGRRRQPTDTLSQYGIAFCLQLQTKAANQGRSHWHQFTRELLE